MRSRAESYREERGRARRVRVSAGVFREEPGQGAHRPVLEGLDRALVLAHHAGGLGDREALEETQGHALLLLGVETAYGVQQRRVREGLQDGVLGGALDLVGVEHLAGG